MNLVEQVASSNGVIADAVLTIDQQRTLFSYGFDARSQVRPPAQSLRKRHPVEHCINKVPPHFLKWNHRLRSGAGRRFHDRMNWERKPRSLIRCSCYRCCRLAECVHARNCGHRFPGWLDAIDCDGDRIADAVV